MRHHLIAALSGALSAALVCALSLGTGPLPWAAGKIAGVASASQNQLSSPTTGTVSGLQLTNSYNNAIDSVNTMNSGASAPTNQLSGSPSPGNWWLDTTSIPYPAQVYDGTDWLTPFWIDATNHVTNVKIGGGTVSVASAATVDLCASSGNVAPRAYITITGTTTITSFGSTCEAGHVKFVTFAGVLTLTYNATNLIIPGSLNVTTAAGDQAVLVALGSGNWQVALYQPASGQALLNPAIDVGDYVMTALTAPPSAKYLFAYGQAISRTTYSTLLSNITITQSVSRTNGSSTLTGFSDTTQIPIGACVEGSGIPNSGSCTITITSCTATTCTMSGNASSSGTANVTIFLYGNGDGATTFNMPDCQGVVLAGRDNMSGTPAGRLTSAYFGVNPDALGALGGAQSQTLAQANLPSSISSVTNAVAIPAGQGSHSHAPGQGTSNMAGSFASGTEILFNDVSSNTFAMGFAGGTSAATLPAMNGNLTSLGGSSTPFSVTQPTRTANCMMRVLSKLTPIGLPASFAANDNVDTVAIIDRRRVAA
jgi:microcystin-dependent protein